MIIGNGSKKNELEEYISSYNLRNKVKIITNITDPKTFLKDVMFLF